MPENLSVCWYGLSCYMDYFFTREIDASDPTYGKPKSGHPATQFFLAFMKWILSFLSTIRSNFKQLNNKLFRGEGSSYFLLLEEFIFICEKVCLGHGVS